MAAGSFNGAIAAATKHLKKPEARLDIAHIAELSAATGHMPLVLHGGSGIKQEYILRAMENGIAKINVATEIRQPGCPENDRLGDGKGMKNMNKELTDVV